MSRDSFFNRDLSWLDFNSRVFAQVSRSDVPLLERVKFTAIVSTNLDEFFMVRVAGLKEQVRTETLDTGPDGLTADQQLDAISARVRDLMGEQSKAWQKHLRPTLSEAGVLVVTHNELTGAEVKYLDSYFAEQIFPVLTPMGVDPSHPFPHLPNRSLSLCVVLHSRQGDKQQKPIYAFVGVPQVLPRFVPLHKKKHTTRFILLEEVIALHLSHLFGGFDVIDSYPIRLTRDSDLEIDEEDAEDLLKVIEAELQERRWGNAVRLELSLRAPESVRKFLRRSLQLNDRDIFLVEGPLHYGDFMFLAQLPDFLDLKYPPSTPHLRAGWRKADSPFDYIRSGDILVHHPYESFSSVADFIDAAAQDPQVMAIKITLYRTSQKSPIMRSLMNAANNGKQVVALVELKARFDEANNIQWARLLEREGVHVVYGIVGLKTHCKACLVVRREGKHLVRYTHLATGNYNPTTAALYSDLGLFTADPVMCEEVANLFNSLTGFSTTSEWSRLIMSPYSMHERLIGLFQTEIRNTKKGRPGRIICKMNSLVDPEIITALYQASCAGVQIDLIVRGICCLRPGVPGLSDNIRVISIIGRFLEHSRIFCFGNDERRQIYLSSADWMQRNFFRRIELMFPVEEPALKQRIVEEILETALQDTANAWQLDSHGTWHKRQPKRGASPVDSHAHFLAIEMKNAAEQKAG